MYVRCKRKYYTKFEANCIKFLKYDVEGAALNNFSTINFVNESALNYTVHAHFLHWESLEHNKVHLHSVTEHVYQWWNVNNIICSAYLNELGMLFSQPLCIWHLFQKWAMLEFSVKYFTFLLIITVQHLRMAGQEIKESSNMEAGDIVEAMK